jgi:hypothetical protein
MDDFTTFPIPNLSIPELPDLGAVTDTSSLVGNRAGSGRFLATALRSYIQASVPVLPAPDFITPQQYGAVADGSDCTAAMNAMLAANPTGLFYCRAGTYGLSSQVTIGSGQFIFGAGPGATVFKVTSAASDIFVFSGPAGVDSRSPWAGLRGFSMMTTVPRTGGRYIYDAAGCPTLIENFSMSGAMLGIEFNDVAAYCLNGMIRDTVATNGVCIKITAGGDHYISNIICDNPTAQCGYGLQITNSGGSVIRSCDFIRCGTGVALMPTLSGQSVDWLFCTDVMTDTCTNYGWLMTPGNTNVIRGAALENCWASSNGTGMLVDRGSGTIDNISLTNFTLQPGSNYVNDLSKIFNDDLEEFNFRSNANDKNNQTIVRFGDFSTGFFFDLSNPLLGIQLTKTNYSFTNFTAANFSTFGQVTNNGDVSFPRSAVTSLANGPNAAIPIGTNVVFDLSGPTGAFSIPGVAGARDGRTIFLLNRTGQTMTISHDSGSDPTPANRIICLTGADKTVTGNSCAILWYCPPVSRWICLYFGQ